MTFAELVQEIKDARTPLGRYQAVKDARAANDNVYLAEREQGSPAAGQGYDERNLAIYEAAQR